MNPSHLWNRLSERCISFGDITWGGGVQCTGIILIILADRCDMQGTARHGKLGLGGGYYPDRFLGWKDTYRVYLEDSGANS